MLPAAGSNVKWDSESRTTDLYINKTDLKSIGAVGGAPPPNPISYHDGKVVYIKHIITTDPGGNFKVKTTMFSYLPTGFVM